MKGPHRVRQPIGLEEVQQVRSELGTLAADVTEEIWGSSPTDRPKCPGLAEDFG